MAFIIIIMANSGSVKNDMIIIALLYWRSSLKVYYIANVKDNNHSYIAAKLKPTMLIFLLTYGDSIPNHTVFGKEAERRSERLVQKSLPKSAADRDRESDHQFKFKSANTLICKAIRDPTTKFNSAPIFLAIQKYFNCMESAGELPEYSHTSCEYHIGQAYTR